MATSYPGSLDAFTNPTGSDTLDNPDHATQHADANDAIEALEAKVGTGAGTPTSGRALVGGATTGSSEWSGDVPVGDGTLAVGDLVTVKSLSPLVVEGLDRGTYAGAGVLGPRAGFFSARYYPAVLGTRTASFGLANGTEHASPWASGSEHTFDRIGVNVSVAGASGSVIRLGIKEVGTDGLPGDLVLDAGTVDATSTGFKEITISETLAPGGYWLVAVGQGSPASNPQVTAGAPAAFGNLGHSAGATAATTPFAGPSKTGVTGALSSGGSWTGINGNAPVVLLRAA